MAETADLSQGDVLSRLTLARHHLADPIVLDPDPQAGAMLAVEQPTRPRASVEPACLVPVVSEGLQCEAVILSQTCDVRQAASGSITVAPVLPMSALSPEQQGACSRDRMLHYVPLASPHGTYVDLHWVAPIAKSSITAARTVGRLTPRDVERLRLKLSIVLGRPALPDDVVAELRLISDVIAGLRPTERELVVGAYAAWDGDALDLLIVTRTEFGPTRLANALQRWLGERCPAPMTRTGRVASVGQVTLAALEGYTRLALDYLSFPVRMEEA
jgi:hypothetical protein